MEDLELSDDELRVEHLRAKKMAALCANSGEADADNVFTSIERACELELRNRKLID